MSSKDRLQGMLGPFGSQAVKGLCRSVNLNSLADRHEFYTTGKRISK